MTIISNNPLRSFAFFVIFFLTFLIENQSISAQNKDISEPSFNETDIVPTLGGRLKNPRSNRSSLTNSMAYYEEVESNNAIASANEVPNSVKIRASISNSTDIDFYKFNANANDRVYASAMTGKSSSTDSKLSLISSDGITIIEFDSNDGSLSGTSSSIAGAIIPTSGVYYLKVEYETPAATTIISQYDLYLNVQSGSPGVEMEGNNAIPGEPLPNSGWVEGNLSSITDIDLYSFYLEAGETVFLSFDLDPERDNTTWNGRLGLGLFGNFYLVVNDLNAIAPNSEAAFFTPKVAGTYYVYIDNAANGTFGTYHLNVSVLPSSDNLFDKYLSSDPSLPLAIATGPVIVSSTLTISDNKRIKKLRVNINLTHTNMPDLDVELTSPNGNTALLFNDVGASTAPNLNIVLDEDAAFPMGIFNVFDGLDFQTESLYSLDRFRGMSTQGTWTLTVRDDAASNGGTINSWSLEVLEDTIITGTILFETDFEANDAGFTHSGTLDEWERGTPTFAPIITANSGTNCFKTDLDNTYEAFSSQTLLSPEIILPNLNGVTKAFVSWAMKYQIESARFDPAYVEIRDINDPNHKKIIWQWLGNMSATNTVGNPNVNIIDQAGWGVYTNDISEFSEDTIQIAYFLSTDESVQLSGMAIDDVKVFQIQSFPSVNLSLSSNVGSEQNVTEITATVTSGSAVTGVQTVTLAVSGANITSSDYTLNNVTQSSVTVTIPNGMTTGSTTFKIVDDLLVEGTETAVLTISNPSSGIILGSTLAQNVSITDDDFYRVMIVGGSNYVTLQQAIDAAAPGDIIMLLANITENLIISESVTIDPNGFSLIIPTSLQISAGKTFIWPSGTLTINPGAIIDNDGTLKNNGIINYQGGTGTFTNTGIYSGTGEFLGNFVNDETINPGN